jgi:branched-chain amino acid transport system substrate-binding protein
MLGQAASYDEAVAEVPGGVTEGFYSMTPVLFVAASDTSPAVTKFAEQYKKQFGKEPNFAAQLGYTAAQLVVLALQKAGKDLTTDSFVTGMESIKDWHDIFGSPAMSFSATKHQGSSESFLCVVKSGHWVPVSTTPVGY